MSKFSGSFNVVVTDADKFVDGYLQDVEVVQALQKTIADTTDGVTESMVSITSVTTARRLLELAALASFNAPPRALQGSTVKVEYEVVVPTTEAEVLGISVEKFPTSGETVASTLSAALASTSIADMEVLGVVTTPPQLEVLPGTKAVPKINLEGKVFFAADGVAEKRISSAMSLTIVEQFGLKASDMRLATSTVGRRLSDESRRLASSWTVVANVSLGVLPSIKFFIDWEKVRGNATEQARFAQLFEKNLAATNGSYAFQVMSRLEYAPVTDTSPLVSPNKCDSCGAGSALSAYAPENLCFNALSCPEAQGVCCESAPVTVVPTTAMPMPVSLPDVSGPGTASIALVVGGVLAGFGLLLCCCCAVTIYRRSRVEEDMKIPMKIDGEPAEHSKYAGYGGDTGGVAMAMSEEPPLATPVLSPSSTPRATAVKPLDEEEHEPQMPEERVHAVPEILWLSGDWRRYIAGRMVPGDLINVRCDGAAFQQGNRRPASDISVFGEQLVRGDGYSVFTELSSDSEVLWTREGHRPEVWKRMRPASAYSVDDEVFWTLVSHDVPMDTAGKVVRAAGRDSEKVLVDFKRTTKALSAGELLAREAHFNDQRSRTALEVLQGEWAIFEGDQSMGSISMGESGRCFFDGKASPHLDLVVVNERVARSDGWSLPLPDTEKRREELKWGHLSGSVSVWRRAKSPADFRIGSTVRMLHPGEQEDSIGAPVGRVIGRTPDTVQVKFPKMVVHVCPNDIEETMEAEEVEEVEEIGGAHHIVSLDPVAHEVSEPQESSDSEEWRKPPGAEAKGEETKERAPAPMPDLPMDDEMPEQPASSGPMLDQVGYDLSPIDTDIQGLDTPSSMYFGHQGPSTWEKMDGSPSTGFTTPPSTPGGMLGNLTQGLLSPSSPRGRMNVSTSQSARTPASTPGCLLGGLPPGWDTPGTFRGNMMLDSPGWDTPVSRGWDTPASARGNMTPGPLQGWATPASARGWDTPASTRSVSPGFSTPANANMAARPQTPSARLSTTSSSSPTAAGTPRHSLLV